ncbi:MAG: DUF2628 domain-containing protein [Pseudolabrys sp.]|jgi:hypothetical protein
MPTYTVHEPPLRKNESVTNPERFAFVRDGFHFWAFLVPPLWFLFKRLWLALLLYIVISVALEFALAFAHVPSSMRIAAELIFALVIGFEASIIRRWTLQRRGWKTLGFVVAEDEEMAERRFFAAWAQRAPLRDVGTPAEPAPVYSAPVRRGPPSPNDVIGLFPEPGVSSTGSPR